MKFNLLVAVTLQFLFACTPKETTVRFHVDARTNQGEPVSAAAVIVDGKILGETANNGSFSGEIKLPVSAKSRVELRKDSDTYYFAPYVQSFEVSSVTPQDVAVAAILYFVPKPSPTSAKVLAGPPANASLSSPDNSPDHSKNTASDANSAATTGTAQETVAKVSADTASLTNEAQGNPQPNNADNLNVAQKTVPLDQATAEQPKDKSTVVAEKDSESEAESQIPDSSVYPQASAANQGLFIFTVHVISGAMPVADVQLAIGDEESSQLKTVCTTNQRGRCVVRFPTKPETPVTFVTSKKGYKTNVTTVLIKNKDKLRVQLEQGHTLDIYAVTESYGHVYGLEDVEVYFGGKKVGVTDKFGRYSHAYSGKNDDLIAVSLKPQSFLPETFETDFVASQQMTLVKYFAPLEPPPARLTVLKPTASGSISAEALAKINDDFTKVVQSSARKMLFSSMAFKEVSFEEFEQKLQRSGKSLKDVARHGWRNTDLKAMVDAVIVPTIVLGSTPVLELSVIDSYGRVMAAGKENLLSLDDLNALDRAVGSVGKRIDRVFPFEGAVLKKEADKVVINLGRSQGRGVKVGDQLDLFGLQTEKLGHSQLHGKIGVLTVRVVGDETATCSVSGLAPRAIIERGDLVRLRTRKVEDSKSGELRITSARGSTLQPVAQANVYFNDIWLGATDSTGRLPLTAKGSGTLKIIKMGYADYTQSISLNDQVQHNIQLKRQLAYLRLESKPSSAVVKLDGLVIGKTPLSTPVSVQSGFVKIELEGMPGYKAYSSVLELDQGTLALVGEEAITLERDFRAAAQNLLKAGKPTEALALLNEISKDHSDYLFGRHEAGEIYLNVLDQPANAAAAFSAVTANEAVQQFTDKRFVASHINEGIALFATAERLATDNAEAARAHYQKALEVLERVMPYLRFVAAKDYPHAVHNVDYHRALCRHRLWMTTQDPKLLVETVRGWRNYLEGSARAIPLDDNSKSYIGNAEVYLKQASASLNSSRSVSRQ